jgi:two-component system sensor histidine kinase RpfC
MPDNVVSLVGHYREALGATGQELTILLAEDNETNQQVIRRILERVGHRVVAVNDGESALDRLAQSEGSFDLLILDLNMPRRGGLEVFQASRFLDPNRPVPTIILTAEATQEALDACKRAGVEMFLTKPVHAKTLLEAVAQLNRPRAAAESRSRGAREPTLAASRAAPRGQPKKPLVDDQKLQEILSLASDPEFFQGLMGGFSRDVAKAIEHLGSAVATADYPGMREAVHALQGTSAEMGALRLADLCLELRRLKPFDMGSAKPAALLGQVREVFAATQVALMEVSRQRRDLST